MSVTFAINGFGRIGRNIARAALGRDDILLVAVNDLGSPEEMTHLLKYDSVHGRFPASVELKDDHMLVAGKKVRLLSERDPKVLPWGEMNVDVVLECTGVFNSREKAAAHLAAGAKKVI
ncbi:UNVERIFIED_CONTAM: hypothetical protein GTU68_009339, partial [Idotea baltica]|nr:hypothetical protein [Idotea baltica]